MKLLRFIGKKVHNYMDFSVDFNKDLTFLIGSNGTGKTTLLKLVYSLISPSFSDLILISFESVELEIENKNNKETIKCEKHKDKIIISVSTIDDKLELQSYDADELNYLTKRVHKYDELVEDINIKHKSHPILKYLSSLPSPIFLGLERRLENNDHFNRDVLLDRERVGLKSVSNYFRNERIFGGSLGASLSESEMIIQDTYRRLKRIEEQNSLKLRDNILLSAFKYTEMNASALEITPKILNEKDKFLSRKKEIEEVLEKIGISNVQLSNEVNNFFTKIENMFSRLPKKSNQVQIEYLINRNQIEIVSQIIEVIDEQKKKNDTLFKPINQFTDTINNYLKDSNKKIEIDTVGRLAVVKPNCAACSIEALSSGERQMLIIITHAIFNKYSQKSKVFIIDEPELSLHLAWQERFVETILKLNDDIQLILATHSPEIVGDRKEFCLNING